MTAILGGYELVETVAAEIGVACSTLHEWCRAGRFPCRRAPHTRRYLIPRDEIAAQLGVSPRQVSAVKAHIAMGTYDPAANESEELLEAAETVFGLERDLQRALR